jgi:hypothetical protein
MDGERDYVSQAVLQNRKDQTGSIARVAAPDIEKLSIAALRHQVKGDRQVLSGQRSRLQEISVEAKGPLVLRRRLHPILAGAE